MNTEPIDATRALALLREVVAERPDHVYETPGTDLGLCVYAYAGRPSCLVGAALHRAGWTVEELARLDLDGVGAASLALRINTVTQDAAAVFEHAQFVQDGGQPWSKALDAAEQRYASIGDSQPAVAR